MLFRSIAIDVSAATMYVLAAAVSTSNGEASAGSAAAVTETPVARRDLPFEFMMNALRLSEGVDRRLFAERTGLPLLQGPLQQAIAEADVILFGPGAFYVSIMPNLLLAEVSEAIRASRARKVLIANLMTEPGQTDLYDVGDYVRAIHAYGGFTLDYVVVNSAYGDRVLNERYAASLATPVFAENSAEEIGRAHV